MLPRSRQAFQRAGGGRGALVGVVVLAIAVVVVELLIFATALTAIQVRADSGEAGAVPPQDAATWLLLAGLVLPVISVVVALNVIQRGARARGEGLREVHIRDRALAAAPDGIVITDVLAAGEPVIFANPAFTRLTGWPLDELLGRPNPLPTSAAGEPADGHADPAPGAAGTTRDQLAREDIEEIRALRRDGTSFWCHLAVAAVRDDEDVVTHRVWTIQDVSPRREAEAALRRREERFRIMTDNSSDITALIDDTGVVTHMSPSVERVLGYPSDAFVSRRSLRFVHPDDRRKVTDRLRAALQDEVDVRGPLTVRYGRASGGYAWLETVVRRVTDDHGRPYLVTNSRDVTERLEAELRLDEFQGRFRETLDTIQLAAVTIDASSQILHVNRRLLEITGWTREELVGRSGSLMLIAPHDPDLADELDQRRNQQLATDTMPAHGEAELVTKLRDRRTMSWNRTFQRDPSGAILSMTSIGEDITERRAREEATQLASARLSTLVENLQAAVLVEDAEHHAVLANQAFCDTFGLPFVPAVLTGWPLHLIVDTIRGRFVDAEAFAIGVEETIARCEPVVGEEVGFADGRVFERDYLPIVHDGGTSGHLWVYRDVTSRVRAADDLRAARDAAEAANRAKSAFLATMSHEIRTPMNGVIGMANLVLDTPLTADQREWVQTIRSSGDALLAIINDILDFSKIEAGHLELETIDFDLRQTVESAIELFAEQAEARGLELIGVVDQAIPSTLRGDPSRLRQVVLNFVSNALKFTEGGEVVVRVTLGDDSYDGTVLLRFEVSDTGIGISEAALARLFRPFTQADSTMARRYGGTGLGLAISRQLTELMGGGVGATSTLGAGSTFWFTARLDVADGAGRGSESHPALRGVRILLVDDNDTSREVLEGQLRSWGMDVVAAADPPRALDALRAAAIEGRPISLAAIDETMPVTDGFTLARLIKGDAQLAATKIVLLAAPGRRTLSGRTVAAGIATYLRKPVRFGELHDVLAGLEDSTFGSIVAGRARTGQEATEDRSFPGIRVLVAEDNHVNARLASTVLGKFGCVVDVAGDGAEALEAASRATYDLVLMDCQMPEVDGFEATRRMRVLEEAAGLPRTPIIAMTANAMAGDRERCLQAGMDDYLAKPLRQDELRAVMRRNLEGRSLVVEPPDAGSPEAGGAAVAPAGAADVPLIDPAQVTELVRLDDGGTAIASELVELLADKTPALVAALREAIEAGDLAAAALAAHTIKGSASQLGAVRLSALGAEAEAIARTGIVEGLTLLADSMVATSTVSMAALRGLVAEAGSQVEPPVELHAVRVPGDRQATPGVAEDTWPGGLWRVADARRVRQPRPATLEETGLVPAVRQPMTTTTPPPGGAGGRVDPASRGDRAS